MRPPLALLLFAALTMRGQRINPCSPEMEADLGARLAAEMRQKKTPVESPLVRGYVEKIGRRLAEHLPQASYQYTVVSDSPGVPTHVPGPLPGGYIFVPAGLLLAVQDDAEFAGMLAHAMAHAAQRLGARVMWLPVCAGDLEPGSAIPIKLLSTQRKFETQADALAIRSMSAAGFDPEALVRYIRRTQPVEPDADREFSGLPPLETRLADMRKAIQELGPRTNAPAYELSAVQTELRGLVPGDKARRVPSLQRP